MAISQVDGAAADLGAHAAAEQQGVQVGALDGLALVGRRSAVAHPELGAERERSVSLGLDHDQDRRRDLHAVARHGTDTPELLADRQELEARRRQMRARALLGQEPLHGVAHRGNDLVEGHDAIMDGDERIGAGAVDAQAGARAEALDADLPGLVIEAHGGLAARAARQVDDGERQVAQDEGAVRLADARGDVRAVDEDVEQLADRAAAFVAREVQGSGPVGRGGGEGLRLGGGDDYLEAHSVVGSGGGHAWGKRARSNRRNAGRDGRTFQLRATDWT